MNNIKKANRPIDPFLIRETIFIFFDFSIIPPYTTPNIIKEDIIVSLEIDIMQDNINTNSIKNSNVFLNLLGDLVYA
ncbi:hypothetical protein GCM10008019_36290 [Deinococcus soli (ex Cha et al. 2016)]|nr:hypothetical protein GCM10008019_36290 [Deinococcus soli (ex Cha et al. 2016)]